MARQVSGQTGTPGPGAKEPRTLPKKEEMIGELNDPKRASQMRMRKGPLRMLSLNSSFNGVTRAEARFQGFE